MKRRGLYIILFMLIAFSMTLAARIASPTILPIKNSKHDLSYGSTASFKSVDVSSGGTTEICVFCHTPHSANDAQLWNREDPNPYGSYTPYDSDVMSALNYTEGDTSLAAHAKTRICLSCHDGTIAMGKLVNLPYGLSADISIQNAAGGTMPNTAAGYIGIDLRDDHPVAIPYVGSSIDQELRVAGSLVNLTYGGPVKIEGGYVECTTCHDAHDNQYGNFLVGANYKSEICRACHNKTGYEGSSTAVHFVDNLSFPYSPPSGATAPTPSVIGTNVGQVKCMNCHYPHKAATPIGQTPAVDINAKFGYYLLSLSEEQSCFNNNDRFGLTSVNACHGTFATQTRAKIESVLPPTKSYGHNVGNSSWKGLHQASEVRGITFPWAPGTTPHVECADCHNPHTAGGGALHTQGTNTATSATSPLYGTGGVAATWGSLWNAPVSYTYKEPYGLVGTGNNSVTYEYEICFKCHSSANSNYSSWGGSLQLAWTDQALEFNTYNRSAHPVVVSLSNQTGSPAPKNLTAAQMGGSWTAGVNKTMFCSDCHGNNTTTGEAQGPHGSNTKWMLTGTNQAWPYTTTAGNGGSTGTFWSMSNASTGVAPNTLFCLNCHPTPPNSGTNMVHDSFHPYSCVTCHIRVPHGGKVSRLISAGTGLPARYYPDGNGGGRTTGNFPLSYTKAANPTSYLETDCYVGVTTPCDARHNSTPASESW